MPRRLSGGTFGRAMAVSRDLIDRGASNYQMLGLT